MKKVIKLNEKQLNDIVKRAIKEYDDNEVDEYINEIAGGELKPDEKKRVIDAILDSSDDYTREELEKLSLKDLLNAFKVYNDDEEGDDDFHEVYLFLDTLSLTKKEKVKLGNLIYDYGQEMWEEGARGGFGDKYI